MKKIIPFTLFLIVCFSAYLTYYQSTKDIDITTPTVKLDKYTRADLAIQQEFEMTKDPQTGEVPRERLWKAREYLRTMQGMKGKAAISGITWSERGPSNVSGRTRTVMFDPNDPSGKRVFAGSVGGGLWVTDDIYAATTSWTNVDEFLDNMAITSIAHDPSNSDIMYFGTGEGFFNIDAIRGDGIFKSSDGGDSWTQLSSSSAYSYVQKLAIDSSGNIYAATLNSGVVKSTDGGVSWSTVLSSTIPGSGTNSSYNRASDVEIASNGDIYVSMGIFISDGIYKSTDDGTTWSKVYTPTSEERIEIACAPTDSNYIYALSQDASVNDAENFLRSTNGGTSWDTLSPPSSFSAQTWYNIGLSVDPNDETNVFVGGLDLWKSTNSGGSFSKVSYWSGSPYVHADHHSIVFAQGSSDTILFGNDGGVFLTTNGSSPSPSFSFQSTDYNVTQFYSCAIHPSAQTDSFLAGAQDNGSHLFSSIGINSTTEVTGGDGAFVHIDQDDPSFMITSYTYNQYRKSTDGGSNFSYVNFSTSGKFINPTDYDNDSYKLFCSHDSGKYFVWTNPKTGSSGATVAFSTVSSGRVSAVFCDPNVSDRVYLGTDAGQIWRINNASSSPSPTQITGVGMSGYVSSIDVEDGDATHILVTYSNYGVSSVWESTDGGSTWTDIDGDLPDMPVRWGMFNPMGPDSVFLATELGVWTTDNINGASTSWGASNTGLANVRTDMLQWRESDSTLIAATHGRGLFSTSFTQVVEPQFIADKELIYQGTEVSFTDGSVGATSWAWDFDNDGNTDATDQNPSWTYNEGGNMTVKLTINGTKSITKTDYVQVIPRLGTPYTSADGGDFETNAWHFGSEAETGTNLWERGSPSNTLTTLNSSSNGWKTDLDANVPQETTKCFLYSPSFNLSESGTYTLSFRKSMQWYYNNAPYAVIVEYSTNGGGLWSKLGTSPDANGTNWYANTGISTLIESDGIGFLEGATNENTEYNISSLAGYSDVRFRFTYKSYQYFSLVGYVDGFMVDDFEISGPVNPPIFDIATEIASTSTESFGSGDSIAFKTADNKILAVVKNLGTHDYGSTTITIDGTGTSTQNFDTNTVAAKQIMNKTFTITPTTNNIAGSYQITTYFTEEEANAWKTNTGNFFKDLTQIKSPGSIGSATIANSVYGTNTIVDSTYDGHNLAITCTYSNGFSGFGAGLGGSGGALPVELISFEGYSYPTHNELKWETALELNSSHFTIEKRTEGEREFEAIGRVAAHGNSNIKHSYSFKDEDISSSTISYYRLKSVDYDGQYKHSQIVIIRPNEELIPIDIFPAPAKDFVKISTSSELESPLSITLRSLSGTVIKEIDYFIEKTTLDVSDITEGTYFITVSQGDRVIETRKIVVLK